MKFIEALQSIGYDDEEIEYGKDKGLKKRYWDIAYISYPSLNGEFNTINGDIWFVQPGEEGLGGYTWTNSLPRLPISDYLERDDWYVVKR